MIYRRVSLYYLSNNANCHKMERNFETLNFKVDYALPESTDASSDLIVIVRMLAYLS